MTAEREPGAEDAPDVRHRAPVRPITRRELRFYAICRFIAVGASRIYFPGRVRGAERIPTSGPFVLAPVHRSNLDWLIVARVTTVRLRYIAKAEIWKFATIGRFIELLGVFPVHRGAADREAFNRALEVLLAGEPLVLFPEGTRGSGPVVGELKEGAAYLAARAGVPIVPVGLSGTEEAMPRGAKLPRPHRVRIVVGEPIYPPAPGESAARPAGRVSRSGVHALSEELRRAIQSATDEAAGAPGGQVGSPADGASGPAAR